jgi:lipoate-protein ligase A
MKLKYMTTDSTDPFLNLATEEFITFRTEPDEVVLYLWQNARTVVIGSNQNPWRECRVEAMKADGCRLARRISGGGAVYHDLGNLNFTFAAREGVYDVEKQTDVILRAVQLLGAGAEKTGRNDLTIDGMKFSGHAYYSSRGFCYHHGTIMLGVDSADMAKYLNVSQKKLRSKGVKSVRSRVTNLLDHIPDLTVGQMEGALVKAFGEVYGGEPVRTPLPTVDSPELSAEDREDFRRLVEKYSSEEWRYGRKIPFDREISERLSWGSVDIELHVVGGVIEQCGIFSDSLMTGIFARLSELIEGTHYSREAIRGLDFSGISDNIEEDGVCRDILDLIANGIE